MPNYDYMAEKHTEKQFLVRETTHRIISSLHLVDCMVLSSTNTSILNN